MGLFGKFKSKLALMAAAVSVIGNTPVRKKDRIPMSRWLFPGGIRQLPSQLMPRQWIRQWVPSHVDLDPYAPQAPKEPGLRYDQVQRRRAVQKRMNRAKGFT